ncbi:alpha/beta-hydrolase [Conidiobolus coronatus NRRL 28638]|uniref:Alpha/beta-hydrolase n=1 Tax=Conidiobolus coronatus (strain ATCC 28846 / CBS 209.66 / NRRL 28638) TaxID=796925 RepID=A0A137P9X5_CONC2|nr:alpha/beta-hydrolase [Conidiobolus coronatus NRRL 28638]|eukprot:KXN71806.1 alpha/beta-hydrolase [Conidiobolus coronatus NRRL 28638]
MKVKISLLNIFLVSVSCPINSPIEINKQSVLGIELIRRFNNLPYFKDMVKIPESFFSDLAKLSEEKPPIKLNSPTKVRTPSIEAIKRHWNHAIYIYCPFSKLIDFRCLKGCTDYKIIKTFENSYYGSFAMIGVESSAKEIIITHRGTMNFSGGLLGFSYDKVRMPNTPDGVLVHEGYLKVYESLASEVNEYVLEMVSDPKYKGYKIWHIYLKKKALKQNFFPITLHVPGNNGFREHAINQNFTIARFTNKSDFVSQLAPRQLNFTHIPGEFHSDSNDPISKNFSECGQDYDEDPNCDWKESKRFSILDHARGFGSFINFLC